MSDNKKQVSPEDEKTQDAAISDEQLSDVAGGGYGIGGKTIKQDVELHDDVKVKRSGYAIGG